MSFVNEFKKIQSEIHNIAVDKGWWREERSIGEALCLVHSEISEALEAARNGNPKDDKIPNFSGLEAELADAIIRILDLAEKLNLNIANAIIEKHEFNKSRPYKHGKKF